jgi:hypothetical protein
MRFTQIAAASGLVGLSTAGSIIPLSARNASPEPGFLKPININQFKNAHQRRQAEVDFSSLDPKQQAELLYGSPGADGQLVLANMVLKAPTGLPIVMMEKFEPLTNSVECNGEDNLMHLTWKTKEALDHAVAKWNYVNEDADLSFLLIANHEGCNPADQRQPHK